MTRMTGRATMRANDHSVRRRRSWRPISARHESGRRTVSGRVRVAARWSAHRARTCLSRSLRDRDAVALGSRSVARRRALRRGDDAEEDVLEVLAAGDPDDVDAGLGDRPDHVGPRQVGRHDDPGLDRVGLDVDVGDALGGPQPGRQPVDVAPRAEQHDGGVGAVDEVGDGPARHDPADVHDDDVRAGHLDLREQVAGHDDGPSGGRIPMQDRAHRRDLRRVEPVGRLVEDEHVGQPEHRLGDAEPLLHPVGVRPDRAVHRATQRGHVEGLVVCGVGLGTAGRGPVGPQVLSSGQVRQEARPLDEGADPGEDRRPGADRLAEDVDGAGVRRG